MPTYNYKKNGNIYSFNSFLTQNEHQNFMNGTLSGTLVGDYYASPIEIIRRSDNTFWGFETMPNTQQLADFQAGTLLGVFVSFFQSNVPLSVPDWVQCRLQIMGLSVFDSKIKTTKSWAYATSVLFSGQQGTATPNDLLDAMNQIDSELLLAGFTSGEKTAINAIFTSCAMGIAL